MAGQQVGSISIKVTPDTKHFRSELEAQLKAIEDSVRGKVKIDLELDTNGIREKVNAATAGLGKDFKIKPDIQIGDSLAKLATLRAALAKDAKLKIEVDVDQNRLQRAVSGIGDKLGSLFSGAGGAGVDLGGFGRTGAIVAAVATLLAPALALISGVLVSLPAVLSSVLIPIAAVALGLDGLKKAAKVLAPDLAALKATMSQRFQDVFTPILTNLKAVFPALQQSLPAVADGLGAMAKAFVDTVTSKSGLDAIKGTIGNIAQTLTDAAPAVGTVTDGLLNLANKVSSKFPAVSGWLNDVGTSFDNWVNKMSTVDSSGTSPLDRAMSNLGGTLKGVLDIIGDLAKQGFDFLQDPKFGQAMKDFVKDVQTLVNDALPGLKSFFMDLTGALNGVTAAVDKIKALNINKGSLGGDPNAQAGPAHGPIPGVLKDNPWTQTVTSFKETVTLVKGMLQTLWGEIQVGFSSAWQGAVTSFQASMSILGTLAQGAWAAVVAAAQTAITSIGSFFSAIPSVLGGAWASLGSIASSAWSQVVSAVSSALSNAVAAVVAGAGQIVSEVVALGGKVVSACANFGSLLVGAGAALIQGLIDGITSLAGAAIAKAVGIATSVANAVKGALGIHSPSTVFTDIGSQTMQGLQNGLDGGFQGVLDRAKALAQQLTDAINGGLTGVDSKPLSDQLKKQIAEIGLEQDQLKVQLNGTTDKGAKGQIKDQRTQLQTIRDQLKQQQDQLGFSQKYGDSLDKNDTILGDSLNKLVDAGKGFAEANIKQAASDLGISGNGAIPQALDQGLSFGMQMLTKLISKGFSGTQIHVNSVDEALAAQQTLTNRQALQFNQR